MHVSLSICVKVSLECKLTCKWNCWPMGWCAFSILLAAAKLSSKVVTIYIPANSWVILATLGIVRLALSDFKISANLMSEKWCICVLFSKRLYFSFMWNEINFSLYSCFDKCIKLRSYQNQDTEQFQHHNSLELLFVVNLPSILNPLQNVVFFCRLFFWNIIWWNHTVFSVLSLISFI